MQTPGEFYWEGMVTVAPLVLEFVDEEGKSLAATAVEIHSDGSGDIRVSTTGRTPTQTNVKLMAGEVLTLDGGALGYRRGLGLVLVTGSTATLSESWP